MQTLTLFVSSPGDVRDERQVVGRVVERIQARYWNFVRIEPVLWEKEPLRATAHFNEELIRPSDCDLFLCVLWSRLGSPLPSQFNRADGSRFDSGTEWELVEATDAFENRMANGEPKPRPDILVYRRMAESPGADPEQLRKLENFTRGFFFNDDGTIRRAFSPYSTVAEFAELLEMHLEKMVLRHIQAQRGLVEEALRPLPVEGSPFKGLGTFEFEDASLFFGRNRAIAETLEQWKTNHQAGHAFLLIYGGSGYGKSSLMRAGLAPRLIAPGYIPDVGVWRRVQTIPGQGGCTCIDSLARAIFTAVPEIATCQEPLDLLELARAMGESESLPQALVAIVSGLNAVDGQAPGHLLLMIDQLEEIFTSARLESSDRDLYFNSLAALAMCGRVWVVATMRSEFFPRIPENRNFYELVRHNGGYILSPPELSELHQIIRYPALAAGLEFERDHESGRDLSEVIYQEAAAAPDALPLLEFTLEQIYERREGNILTWKSYHDLGGLAGAIAQRAQEVFETLDRESRGECAGRIFSELVTLDGDQKGPATRRRARRDGLETVHSGAAGFLDSFIHAKLLVTSSEEGVPMITLAHESLTTHWPFLRNWIGDHRDLLQARARLEAATRLWLDSGRSPKLLLAEGRLAEGQRVFQSGVFQLGEFESEFINLSSARAKRKLRLFQIATAVFAVLALAAGALGIVAKQRQQKADRAERLTRLSLAEADFDAAAARAQSNKPDEALPFLLESLKSDPLNLEAQALLLSTLRQTAWHMPVGEIQHPQPVTQLGFGVDSNTLFAGTDFGNRGDGFNSVLKWDIAGKKMSAHLAPGGNELQTLSVSPGAAYMIVQRGYKRADATLVCDAASMDILQDLSISSGISTSCFAWSPDGKHLAFPHLGVYPEYRKTWRILELPSGNILCKSTPWRDDVDSPLAAHFDGKTFRAIHADGKIFEMDVRQDRPEMWSQLDQEGNFDEALYSTNGRELLIKPSEREGNEQGSLVLYQLLEEDGKIRYNSGSLGPDSDWLKPQQFRKDHSWTYWYSPVWQKLMSANQAGDMIKTQGGQLPLTAPIHVNGPRLEMADGDDGAVLPVAPFIADAAIKSLAFRDDRIAVGTASGKVHLAQLIPRIGYSMKSGPKRSPEETVEWTALKKFPDGRSWERRYGELLLRDQRGAVVPLQQHPNWQMVADCSLRSDGERVVLAGYGSSTGGYVSPGLLMVDAMSGRVLSDLEPLEAPSAVEFLADGKRLVAIGSDEVVLLEWTGGNFKRLGTIPVADATALYPFSLTKNVECLALASADQVKVYALTDLSLISTMSLPRNVNQEIEIEGGLEPRETAWAFDQSRGWLAMRLHQRLSVWQIQSGRTLLTNVRLPDGSDEIRFEERSGLLGVSIDGDVQEFVFLAKVAGVSAMELGVLADLSRSLAGVDFADDSRAIVRLERAARMQCAAEVSKQADTLTTFSLDVSSLVAGIPQNTTTISSQAWGEFWQRLLLSSFPDYDQIARNTSSLVGEPWREMMIRGLIAIQDARLFSPAISDSESIVDPDSSPFDNRYEDVYHRLAGDSVELQNAKSAAWKVKFTTQQTAGAALVAEEWSEEWKGIDPKAVAALDPKALEDFKKALESYPQNDERKVILTWVGEREQAQAAVLNYLEVQRANYQKNPTAEVAYILLEALLVAGKREEAEALVVELGKTGETPSLSAAHGLIAADLTEVSPALVERALKKHQSSWLLRDWFLNRFSRGMTLQELAPILLAAGPRANVANAELLKLALRERDVPVIEMMLNQAEELPSTIRAFMQDLVDWESGNQKAVFARWPAEFPDHFGLAESEDWLGWEQGLEIEVCSDFFKELEEASSVLVCPEKASGEDVQNVASRLLDPESEDLFGKARIAAAIPGCCDQLLLWQETVDTLGRMFVRAEAVGLAPFAKTRLEAQLRSAEGNDSSASELWKQVVDQEQATHNDVLACAFVSLKLKKSLEAFRILSHGLDRFSDQPSFKNDAAWLLLQFSLPAEALDVLEQKGTDRPSDDVLQMRSILAICAADQSAKTERADELFKQYVTRYSIAFDEEVIKSLNLPELVTETLITVAKRNR